jgi:hypothetical protein
MQCIRKNRKFTSFVTKRDATGKKIFRWNVKKRQRCAVVNLENNFSISAKFTNVYCNQHWSQNKLSNGFYRWRFREVGNQ